MQSYNLARQRPQHPIPFSDLPELRNIVQAPNTACADIIGNAGYR